MSDNKKPESGYEKPKVIYRKKIEVLSAVCNSARDGFPDCQKNYPPCTRLET